MKIAIIGAGVTGSSCAAQLQQLGHRVTVFEKSRGKGGRCARKRVDWAEFDLGAPVIPASDPAFIEQLVQLEKVGVAAKWLTGAHKFCSSLQRDNRDSLYYVFSPSMNSACHYWLQDIEVISNCRITHLQQTKSGWLLWDEGSAKHGCFDWVICTAPWPQSHALLADTMALPTLTEQRWTSCWAVACTLNRQLRADTPLIYFDNCALQTLVLDSQKPGRNNKQQVWVAYLANPLSDELDKSDLSKPKQLVETTISQVFGNGELKITHHYQHFWRFARAKGNPQPLAIVQDHQQRLSVCGDWSVGASVQAAYLAAHSLAGAFS